MDKMLETGYAQICGILMNEKKYNEAEIDFERLSMEAGVAPVRLENLFYERFGMSCNDVLRTFRRYGRHA